MTMPLISIDRQSPDSYEWFLTWEGKLHHSAFGQHDIVSCLENAGETAPAEHGTVEIVYRHVHMGTHLLAEVMHDAPRLSKQICDQYAKLKGASIEGIE
jgi:hypothetical protein